MIYHVNIFFSSVRAIFIGGDDPQFGGITLNRLPTSYTKTSKPNKDGGMPLKQGTTRQ